MRARFSCELLLSWCTHFLLSTVCFRSQNPSSMGKPSLATYTMTAMLGKGVRSQGAQRAEIFQNQFYLDVRLDQFSIGCAFLHSNGGAVVLYAKDLVLPVNGTYFRASGWTRDKPVSETARAEVYVGGLRISLAVNDPEIRMNEFGIQNYVPEDATLAHRHAAIGIRQAVRAVDHTAHAWSDNINDAVKAYTSEKLKEVLKSSAQDALYYLNYLVSKGNDEKNSCNVRFPKCKKDRGCFFGWLS
eukprot:TRINITY_DN49215_c0_g1_i1.p1 TRINITY_DN49215_c0_g1~~TRINITY_DN49215_c0_g1_i1.p1  ORF type:complete len:263 (+),score=10.67 TRINITY_DN49215_c0_g1_i1:60-791(+)